MNWLALCAQCLHTHAHAQKDTQAITSKCTGIDTHTDSSGRAKKYLPLFQTNSIFIQDICKLIKMANKDWRNMSHPSGLDTILSAALAMACLLLLCPFLSKSLLFSLMTFLHHLMPSCIPSFLPSFRLFMTSFSFLYTVILLPSVLQKANILFMILYEKHVKSALIFFLFSIHN